MTLKEYIYTHKRFVAAHRGASGTRPENTIAAIDEALRCGASMVEIDIQITKDGVPIAFHDDTLGRTASGISNISDIYFDDLKNLSAGAWFDSDFASERIPSLEQVIEHIHGRAYLGLEIKPSENSIERANTLLNVINKYEFASHCVLASFDYRILRKIKELNPKLHTAAVRIPGDDTSPSALRESYGIEAFICAAEELNEPLADDIRNSGIVLGVYGLDTHEEFLFASGFPITAFGTNFPCIINNLLKSRFE